MKTLKITDSQKAILHLMIEGGTLTLSKRMGDYGKHYVTINGQKHKVNSTSVDGLMKANRITVDECGNLEVSFKLNY